MLPTGEYNNSVLLLIVRVLGNIQLVSPYKTYRRWYIFYNYKPLPTGMKLLKLVHLDVWLVIVVLLRFGQVTRSFGENFIQR